VAHCAPGASAKALGARGRALRLTIFFAIALEISVLVAAPMSEGRYGLFILITGQVAALTAVFEVYRGRLGGHSAPGPLASSTAALASSWYSSSIRSAGRGFCCGPYTNRGTDLDFYFGYVQRAASGEVPYRDFAVEYPPAAWLLMRAPGTTDWVSYVHRFAWIATALEVAAFAFFLAIAWQLSPRRFWLVAATYVVTTTLLREFSSDQARRRFCSFS
jgi:hypothetical protein